MITERTSVGLDVHARSVAAAIDGDTGELHRRLGSDHGEIAAGWRPCRARWR